MRTRIVPLLLLCVGLAGCGPKFVDDTVFASEDLTVDVRLRQRLEGGEPVPRGHQHPAIVSDVRIAHILAHLQYEDKRNRKLPVVRSFNVYDFAEGMSKALALAGPDDVILARAFHRDQNLQIFTVMRVTALRAYMRQDQLILEFYAIEERLEKESQNQYRGVWEFPDELPSYRIEKQLVPGEAHALYGKRGYAVNWRDPFFRRAVSLGPGGIRRRTILMEEAPEPEDERSGEVPVVSAETRDAQLRALDELDGLRRAGLIQEIEFTRRRRLVLEGKLEEAGFGTEP